MLLGKFIQWLQAIQAVIETELIKLLIFMVVGQALDGLTERKGDVGPHFEIF